MKRWYWSLGVLVILGVAWFGRESWLPSETSRIQHALEDLAKDASFGSNEGNVAAVRRIGAVVDRFAADAQIEVDLLGVGTFHLTGRDEIQQSMMAARRVVKRLVLQFHDIVVQLGAEPTAASAHLTATADAEGYGRNQGGFDAIEFAFDLKKIEGRWRIQQVRTVPTLKQ